MKVLIRRIHDHPQAYRWRAFEATLKTCLLNLNHEILELDLDFGNPWLPPDPPEAEYVICAHKTRRDVPTAHLFYKEMHMHYLFTVDREGWGADDSRMKARPDLNAVDCVIAREFCAQLRAGFLSTGHSKHRQPPLRPIDAVAKPYLLAPLQSPADEVIRHHSPLTVKEFIETLADWAEARQVNVVFELHPGSESPDTANLVDRRVSSSRYVFVVNANIHSLISESQGVVVINSGTGFESLIHGKPVITMGHADYGWFTHFVEAGDLDSGMEYVETYTDEQRDVAYRFIYFYYNDHAYLIHPDRPVTRPRMLEYLKNTLRK